MAHKNKTNLSPYTARQNSADRVAARGLHGKHKKPETIFTVQEANDRLFDLFRNHDFADISHAERMELAKFYRLLMENQEKENFTRLVSIKDVGIRHFIDCLMVPKLTQLKFPLMDVGTGPGFPGIPLKIHFPEEHILLAEGVQRRVEFLKHVREQMNLRKLDIIGRNINPFCAYPVNAVITRAVEDVRNTLNNVLTCLNLGGHVYLMKGPGVDPEIEVAKKECDEHYELIEDHAYVLPKTDHKRRLLVYKKVKPAPIIDFEDEPWPDD